MNKALVDILYEKFPNLYVDKNAPKVDSMMSWGIQADDGWYDLVTRVSEKLEAKIIAWMNTYPDSKQHPRAYSVKQKLGELRITLKYPQHTSITDAEYKDFESVLEDAENASIKICERCGKPGTPHIQLETPWVQVLCLACAGTEYRPYHDFDKTIKCNLVTKVK